MKPMHIANSAQTQRPLSSAGIAVARLTQFSVSATPRPTEAGACFPSPTLPSSSSSLRTPTLQNHQKHLKIHQNHQKNFKIIKIIQKSSKILLFWRQYRRRWQ
jgi:hypothetical protein